MNEVAVLRTAALLSVLLLIQSAGIQAAAISLDGPGLPRAGDYQLRIISPRLLELSLISTKAPNPAPPERWPFVGPGDRSDLPSPGQFQVFAAQKPAQVEKVSFRRRVLYAPLKTRDLRIGNYLYLHLGASIASGNSVEVRNQSGAVWPPALKWMATNSPIRLSPVLHVNQTGYMASKPKIAFVGYYLGDGGELDLAKELSASAPGSNQAAGSSFVLIENTTGREVFKGCLRPRPDQGFPYNCYQNVYEADFSKFNAPGEYRLSVPGLGASYPFQIDDALIGAFARTYALGLYHQRCGTDNRLPFTRFVHGACHIAPAEVPTLSNRYASANHSLEKETENYRDNPRHTAPRLKSVAASLYPFVRTGSIDVSGGHHDAGDYSKYTINSAGFIHHLMLSVDLFPGVASLDNLGIPESGDGIGDLLQEAKWEADFLCKMQDSDGGFYFLVYPRGREYENDVLPDHGDPQVVFPKTTSATAAAVAALAQCASSPHLKRAFPEAAAQYLERASKGWVFLQKAIERFGKDGAYQKITHYGDEFMHDDELAWAACEMFLATGSAEYNSKLVSWLKPDDPNTRKWGWLRLFDAYGCAIRSYTFGAKTGRLRKDQQSAGLLAACEHEIAATGMEQLQRAKDSAYGTSFPLETKRARSAGWYFSSDAAFDLAVACQLDYPEQRDPRPEMMQGILSNMNYEQGCNPVDVTFLTGLGHRRQREIVHQYAQNDRRVLPPSGIPLGNIQAGFGWLEPYGKELGELSYLSDGSEACPYPIYDRWGDSFNLSQEFVILNQARALGYLAWLMSQSPLAKQPWKGAKAAITGLPNAPAKGTTYPLRLTADGIDLRSAQVIWETSGQEPVSGPVLQLKATGPGWVEAEAALPDGRRVQASLDYRTQ